MAKKTETKAKANPARAENLLAEIGRLMDQEAAIKEQIKAQRELLDAALKGTAGVRAGGYVAQYQAQSHLEWDADKLREILTPKEQKTYFDSKPAGARLKALLADPEWDKRLRTAYSLRTYAPLVISKEKEKKA